MIDKAKNNIAKRKKLFGILLMIVIVATVLFSFYWYFIGSHEVSTDNAYVQAEVAQVTASVGGIVKEVLVTDTQNVKKGDVLAIIDDADAKLALASAEAELGRAERRVRGYFANDEGLAAQISAREAEQNSATAQLDSASADLKRAEVDLNRRKKLASSGSVSGEELTNAQNAFAVAKARYNTAKAAQEQALANRNAAVGSLNVNEVLTADTTVETNPEVAFARAKRDQAIIDLERTTIRASIDGVVARRQVQIGQRIEMGSPLMIIVPLNDVYVEANFKEVQLDRVKVGQPVTLKADIYGSGVVFHGKVAGFSGGTGSAFALIPAQNATGNWIKVVQRLPVRVTLDKKELQKHPLQVGLSMTATIDISK
jgi:membrane fusion protein, multidrug efflux system